MTVCSDTMIAARFVKANSLRLLEPGLQSNRPVVETRGKLLQRVENASCNASASSMGGDIHSLDFHCGFVNSTEPTTTDWLPAKPGHYEGGPRCECLVGRKRTRRIAVAYAQLRAEVMNKTCRNFSVGVFGGDGEGG